MTTNYYYYDRPAVFGGMRLTPVVKALLIANVAVYLLQWLLGPQFTALFGLSAAGLRHGWLWQLFTYMFLHSPRYAWHLIFNMLVLVFMGPQTERALGGRHFLIMYVLSGMLGGLAWILLGFQELCIGASGAIYGVLGAFAMLFPRQQITLLVFFVLPVTMPAWVMVAGLAAMELLLSLGQQGEVAHWVHVSGALVGAVYVWVAARRAAGLPLPWRWPAWRRPRLRVMPPVAPPPVSAAEVDQVLDKIANRGVSSLTREERELLERASQERRSLR